ncbi:MAG: hypothetical protein SGJ17_12200 [Hyphomicrobiales bacterium]|nr:hypothetical protein [Hyphomicrobiales bacterium]
MSFSDLEGCYGAISLSSYQIDAVPELKNAKGVSAIYEKGLGELTPNYIKNHKRNISAEIHINEKEIF